MNKKINSYSDSERIAIIAESAKLFNENFASRNILIIRKKDANLMELLEINAYDKMFLHLTGVNTNESANEFFDKAVFDRLTLQDFTIRDTGETDMKLSVIDKAMNFTKSANLFIGDFSNANSKKLNTEIVLGTREFAMGFVLDANSQYPYYVPNTLLKDDVERHVTKINRVLAVFEKDTTADKYDKLLYISRYELKGKVSQDATEKEKLDALKLSKVIKKMLVQYDKQDNNTKENTLNQSQQTESAENKNNYAFEKKSEEMQAMEIIESNKIKAEATRIVDERNRQNQQVAQVRQAEQDKPIQQIKPVAQVNSVQTEKPNKKNNNKWRGK